MQVKNKKDNPFTLEDLNKAVNKESDKKKTEEKKKND